MLEGHDTIDAAEVALLRNRSIVAAAGCGKTDLIARATSHGNDRRLILTHTHAGVDALRKRLKDYQVPSGRYLIDTIGGWCLRYAASYPKCSGLAIKEPTTDKDWLAIYAAV